MNNEFQQVLQAAPPGNGSMLRLLQKYLRYYPLFLVCMVLSIGAAVAYLRYTVPLYRATTFINVKGETNLSKGGAGGGDADLIHKAMNGGRSIINLDNELARLRSARLMERVVRNSDLNITYYKKGKVRVSDIYHDAPFRLIPRNIQDSSAATEMEVLKPTSWGVTLRYTTGEERLLKAVRWNLPFVVAGNTFILNPQVMQFNAAEVYRVRWTPVFNTVYELLPNLSVNVIGKTSNIGLSIDVENPERGQVILNRMVGEFIQMNLDDQNKAAQDKIYFIEERLSSVSSELKGVEKNLSGYQGRKLMVGGQDATVSGMPIAEAGRTIASINTQLRLLAIISGALTNSGGAHKVLPSGLAFSDEVLSGLIGQYNTLVLTRQREAPQVAGNSLVLKDLDNQLQATRRNILDNLDNISRGLKIQLASLQAQGSQFKASLASVPEKTRVLGEISREKSVKEELYVYLLQKREEAAIAKTNTSPYEQIDAASSYGPVSPVQRSVLLYALLAGLALPLAVVSLREAFFGKVDSAEAAVALSGMPLAGTIGQVKAKDRVLPALEPGAVGEQFRNLRMSLGLLGDTRGQVVLLTSAVSGEGKSFVSQNLAVVLAKAGRKVALLELDIRKPADCPLEEFHGPGLGDYLAGQAPLEGLVRTIEGLPSLHIYPSGTVAPNAADLLVTEKVTSLFETLRQQYDVVVVNAAPVGLVTDAMVLQRFATVVAFVVRQGITPIKDLVSCRQLVATGKLGQPQLVVNGIRQGKKYGYPAYGTRGRRGFALRG